MGEAVGRSWIIFMEYIERMKTKRQTKSRQVAPSLALALVVCLGTLCCRSHFELQGVERTRILIDSRYDGVADEGVALLLAPYKQKVDSVMGPVVGEVSQFMAAGRPESTLSNLLSDILVWAAKDYGEEVALGVYNVGGIRAALAKGKVTYGDVLDVAPFDNKICFLTLTGEQLLELFAQIAFRGGEGVSHGTQLVISRDHKLVSARLHGLDIDPASTYRVATIDYLAQGNDQLVAFKKGTALNSPQEEKNNTRYIIMNYFREQTAQGRQVSAQVEGRIVLE